MPEDDLVSRLQNELEEEKKRRKKANLDLFSKSEEVNELKVTMSSMEEEYAKSQEQLDLVMSELESKEDELLLAADLNRQKEAELKQLKFDYECLKGNLEELREQLGKAGEDGEEEGEGVPSNLANLRRLLATETARVKSLSVELEGLRAENSRLQAEANTSAMLMVRNSESSPTNVGSTSNSINISVLDLERERAKSATLEDVRRRLEDRLKSLEAELASALARATSPSTSPTHPGVPTAAVVVQQQLSQAEAQRDSFRARVLELESQLVSAEAEARFERSARVAALTVEKTATEAAQRAEMELVKMKAAMVHAAESSPATTTVGPTSPVRTGGGYLVPLSPTKGVTTTPRGGPSSPSSSSSAALELVQHLKKQLGESLKSGAEASVRAADAEAALVSVRARAERLSSEVESLMAERREREVAARAALESATTALSGELERERVNWKARLGESERSVEEAQRREEWAKGESMAMRTKMLGLENEWVDATAAAREAKAAAAAARSEAARLGGELEALQSTVTAAASATSSAERGASASRAAALEAESTLASTRNQLASARGEVGELKVRLSLLTEELAGLRASSTESATARARGEGAVREVDRLRSALHAAEESASEAWRERSAAIASMASSTATAARCEAAAKGAESALERERTARLEAEAGLATGGVELVRLRGGVSRLEGECSGLTSALASSQSEARAARSAEQSLRAELEACKEALTARMGELESLRGEVALLRAKLGDAGAVAGAVEEQMTALVASEARGRGEVSQLRAELESVKRERTKLAGHGEALEKEVLALESAALTLRTSLNKSVEGAAALSTEHAACGGRLEALASRLTAVSSEREQWESKCGTLEREGKELRGSVHSLTLRREALERECEELRDALGAAERTCVGLRGELSGCSTQVSALQSSARVLEDALASERTRGERTALELVTSVANHEALKGTLDATMARLTAADSAAIELRTSAAAGELYKVELSSTRAEVSRLKAECIRWMEDARAASAAALDSSGAAKTWEEKCRLAEEGGGKSLEMLRELRVSHDALTRECNVARERNETLDSQCRGLNTALASLTSEFTAYKEEASRTHAALSKEVVNSADGEATAAAKVEALAAEVNSLHSLLVKLRDGAEAESRVKVSLERDLRTATDFGKALLAANRALQAGLQPPSSSSSLSAATNSSTTPGLQRLQHFSTPMPAAAAAGISASSREAPSFPHNSIPSYHGVAPSPAPSSFATPSYGLGERSSGTSHTTGGSLPAGRNYNSSTNNYSNSNNNSSSSRSHQSSDSSTLQLYAQEWSRGGGGALTEYKEVVSVSGPSVGPPPPMPPRLSLEAERRRAAEAEAEALGQQLEAMRARAKR